MCATLGPWIVLAKNSLKLQQNKLLFFVNLEQVFHRVFGASPG